VAQVTLAAGIGVDLGLIVVLSVPGNRNRHRNAVAAPPTIHWSDLAPTEDKSVRKESSPTLHQ
jgi:hypothetical protein